MNKVKSAFQIVTLSAGSAALAFIMSGTAFAQEGGRGRPPMSDEQKVAMEACKVELKAQGLSFPEPGGERPDRETMHAAREAMDACLEEKGVEMPRPPKHDGQRPQQRKARGGGVS